MKSVIILEKLVQKRDLIVIPRKEYEEFSAWKKTVRVRLDEQWFWSPEWQKKEKIADKAIKSGKVAGPFSNHKELLSALKKKNRK